MLELLAVTGQCQPSRLDWSTLAGGSGTSTSVVYAVSGTIGQPDTGRSGGGAYTCEGGFWCVVLETPGAPLLSVAQSHGAVTVSWPLPATGWVLEETNRLASSPGPWPQVPASQYQTNATHISITISAPVGTHYYRLRKP